MTRWLAAAAVLSLLLSGCVLDPRTEPDRIRLMVPTPAGGGYDATARALALTMDEAGLAEGVEVFNLSGSAGTTALARLVHEEGNAQLLMQMGLGLVGSTLSTGSPHTPSDATPLARLVEEPEVVVVPADSTHRSFGDLVTAWRSEQGLRAGVGSHPGGPDHQALMLIAEQVGLTPGELPFDRYDGGGELLAAMLSHRVDFAVTGSAEYRHAIRAGRLRVLAVTGPERLEGIDAPTLRETGHDLEVLNWRGLMAPPGITREERRALVALLGRLRASGPWQRTLRENGWRDAYLPGEAFGRFLDAEDRRVGTLLDRFDDSRP